MHKHYNLIQANCITHKINIESNYIVDYTQMHGGSTFEAVIGKNGEKYSFNYYISEINNSTLPNQLSNQLPNQLPNQQDQDKDQSLNGDKLIFIYKNSDLKSIQQTNNEFDNRIHCAMLSYKNKDSLKILILNSSSKCVKCVKSSYGTALLKIIIKYAKKYEFKSILLDDESKYFCSTKNNLHYKLQLVHTLTHGYPWYAKFGFKFINNKDNKILKHNKEKLDNLKTFDLSFDGLMYIIFDNIVHTKSHTLILGEDNFINSINNIINIYLKNKEKTLYNFFSELTRHECDIMCLIYNELFKALKLEHMPTSMILNLQI